MKKLLIWGSLVFSGLQAAESVVEHPVMPSSAKQQVDALGQKLNTEMDELREVFQSQLLGGGPIIEASSSCSTGKLQIMPLGFGFNLSLCAKNNVDFTKVDKVHVLKLLIELVQQRDEAFKAAGKN